MIDFLSGTVGALVDPGALAVAVFAWLLASFTQRRNRTRADAAAQRADLEARADVLILAVTEAQAAAITLRLQWDGPRERFRLITQAASAAAGGYARARLTAAREGLCVLAGAAEFVRAAARNDRDAKTALIGIALPAAIARVAAAALPLTRNADPAVAATAQRVLEAVPSAAQKGEELTEALHQFEQAVRAALTARTARWRRLPGIRKLTGETRP
ncbi:hypothetical protein RM780_25405 [Streptomyces sp. DSM 44917]|uniref:Uncharacterized protein n=1 Tax=Streptomyces boetiae TaxID=3075541 RepID=A0ABU2LF92_9ACTN|nr:hypothetical protein [Streptomyces sp. DSM 44917]MDT0310264.1 hypothetical protein [Streptomyces sp. DSM 44917]